MDQTITAKVQVYVPNEYQNLFNKTMDVYSSACNFVSEYIFKTHILKHVELNKELYRLLRENFNLKSQMAQSVLKTVVSKYKTILHNQKKWIKPVFDKPQCDLVWNRDYSLTQNLFSVNTLEGRIKLPYAEKYISKYFDKDKYSFGTAKLVHKRNKYFLHIPVTFKIKDSNLSDICNVVGVDRGINFVVATYDSKHKSAFVSGKQIKQKRAQYSKLRKELQMRKTPSARRRLKAIGQRENRWMQDINHQVSKALVENNPKHTLFVLEDLTGIRSATEGVKTKSRYVSVSWSFYDLEQKLKYKAQQNESVVIGVDPKYTSQCCPMCGHTEKSNRNKKKHLFRCKNCGYSSNDDRIGAMNLYRKGIEYMETQTKEDTVTSE